MSVQRTTAPTRADPRSVQSIDRALDILELLAGTDAPLGLTTIAAGVGLAPATTHRLLRSMQARGYVQHVAERKYTLGTAAMRLGTNAQRSIAVGAQPYLDELVRMTGETANLAALNGDAVVYVAQSSSPHILRMFAEVGRRVLPHTTAVGKILLAAQPDDKVTAVLKRTGLPRRTERTITTIDGFLSELEHVRTQGYAVDNGEEDLGIRCLAMPIRTRDSVPAAVSVSGPAYRLGDDYVNRLIEPLSVTAVAIAHAIEPSFTAVDL